MAMRRAWFITSRICSNSNRKSINIGGLRGIRFYHHQHSSSPISVTQFRDEFESVWSANDLVEGFQDNGWDHSAQRQTDLSSTAEQIISNIPRRIGVYLLLLII
jgi:hypothetical protein